ncbi:MAG: bifunctional DNA-formamidopyrimidine glycosylase/DNA-(apurinic or apyrimidinic site) lyase [Gemmatimonadaceae bacterium]
MPELPETETMARDMDARTRGAAIREVRVWRPNVLRRASPASLARRLTGARIGLVRRRAKHIIFELTSGDRVAVQPRFTGTLTVTRDLPADPRADYLTVSLGLSGGRWLHYADVRRLGTVTLFSEREFAAFVARLGVEPLEAEFTNERLSAALASSQQAVKKVVMDQSRVAGVGNIYAAEALWRAGVDPSRPAASLRAAEVAQLRRAIVDVLRAAVRRRGTTIRDYRDADGEAGGFAARLKVYGRASLPCARCGTRLVGTQAIDGRTTVFCFRCQR